jgi:hypothetical protein
MPESNAPRTSIPSTVPKSSGGGPYVAAIVVLILLIGGMAWWKFHGAPPPPTPVMQTVSVATNTTTPPLFDMPPPPEIDAGNQDAATDSGAHAKSFGAELCGGKCSGTAPASLQSALSGAAAASRSCYERALRNNPMLQGRMTVSVRVASNGSVCSAGISQDGLGSPDVSSCVKGLFSGRSFPAPTGGTCVDVNIPLSFTPRDGKK